MVAAGNQNSLKQRQKILAVVRAIEAGQTASYGEVAHRAGLPGRARLVARVLAENDEPKTPWHRVVRRDGRIGFPEGSQGFIEQTRRLAAEGIRLKNGRLLQPAKTLDQMLWGPEA